MKTALPALMQAARESSQKGTREAALLAAGHLDPELRGTDSEIADLLNKEEEDRAWLARRNSRKANFFELQKDLKDPERAVVAAHMLGEMGPVAADAVPDMIQAFLATKEQSAGKQIHDALKKIDPEAAKNYEPIPLEVLQSAMEKVQLRQPASNKEEMFGLIVEMVEGRTSGPWTSRAWLQEFGEKLAAVDADTYQTFVTNIVKRDPSLKSAFVR